MTRHLIRCGMIARTAGLNSASAGPYSPLARWHTRAALDGFDEDSTTCLFRSCHYASMKAKKLAIETSSLTPSATSGAILQEQVEYGFARVLAKARAVPDQGTRTATRLGHPRCRE
jgi:hypothetical protein